LESLLVYCHWSHWSLVGTFIKKKKRWCVHVKSIQRVHISRLPLLILLVPCIGVLTKAWNMSLLNLTWRIHVKTKTNRTTTKKGDDRPMRATVEEGRWEKEDGKENQFEAQMCVSGYGQHESEIHLYLSCPPFGRLWQLVRNWLGVYLADPSNTVDHFYHFGTSSGFGKSRCSLMHMIWFACSWVIYGRKEMTGYFTIKKILHISLWRRLNFYSYDGLKLNL